MFMKTLYTPGVAHLSYIFGNGGHVRSKEEFESSHLRTAVHVYVGDLPSKLEQIPKRRPITTFCESGPRSRRRS